MWRLETNLSEIYIQICTFEFQAYAFEYTKWLPISVSVNMLKCWHLNERQPQGIISIGNIITMMSHERHVVSNCRSFDCLFDSLREPTSKKYYSPFTGPLWEELPVKSPYKGPVTRKNLPLDNFINLKVPCSYAENGLFKHQYIPIHRVVHGMQIPPLVF